MDLHPEVKTAIKELPPAERVITMALKQIYEKIKELHLAKRKEIETNHMNFNDRFSQIEKQASKIIEGKALEAKDLPANPSYFSPEDITEREKFMSGVKLENYWLKVLKNSTFSGSLTESDERILPYLYGVRTNVTPETLEITLILGESEHTTAGTFTKILTLDGAQPIEYTGDELKLKTSPVSGFFQSLNSDSKDFEELSPKLMVIGQFINEVVPYSLEYYLGIVQEDDGEDYSEDEQENEDENEEEEEPKDAKKKTKI